jgi:membrane-anchored protein YejM (alkaline phosphatase superfamily)
MKMPIPPALSKAAFLIANCSLLIAHFSFFPFTFYLFAVAIRVALIFVLKSESLMIVQGD